MKKRSELQSEFVYRIVEGMDMDTLVQWALDRLNEDFDKYTDEQLLIAVDYSYPDLLED